MNLLIFISFWVSNSLFFYLAFLVWPGSVVLGNDIRSPVAAAMLNGFLLTIVIAALPLILKTVNFKVKTGTEQTIIYLVFNTVAIWVLAHLATFTGFGITAFWVAIVLGFGINLLQWAIDKAINNKGK